MNTPLLARLMIVLSTLLAGLNMTARAFGGSQPPNPELDGFITGCEAHPQPCWYGIVPGVTLMGDAWSQLEKIGYETGGMLSDRSLRYVSFKHSPKCVEMFYDHEAARVNSIILGCADLRLGDVLALIGSPANRLWYTEHDADWPVDRVMIGLSQAWLESPFASVGHLRLVRAAGVVAEESDLQPWRGFLPRWRYCQLQPVFAGCR